MMFRTTGLCAALAAGLLTVAAAAAPANAAVITRTYAFTLGDFIDVGGGDVPPPMTSLSGSFTVTFDPDLNTTDGTSVVVNALSDGSVDSPIGYTNFAAGGGFPDFLSIGGLANGADFIAFGVNDVAVTFKFFDPSHPAFAICDDGYACGNAPGSTFASGYTLAAFPNSGWLATSGTVTQIPEPAAWTLMLAGFGALGGALRQRRPRAA